MAQGVRISREGEDARKILSESSIKDFVFLSDREAPKVYYAGFLEGPSELVGVSYEHNLGYIPMFFLFSTDSITSPTYFRATGRNTTATTTTIDGRLMRYAFLIILREGNE